MAKATNSHPPASALHLVVDKTVHFMFLCVFWATSPRIFPQLVSAHYFCHAQSHLFFVSLTTDAATLPIPVLKTVTEGAGTQTFNVFDRRVVILPLRPNIITQHWL